MTKEQIKTELNRLFERVMQADIQLRHFEAIYYYVDFIKRTPILWEIVDAKEGGEYQKATDYIKNPDRTREEKNLRHSISRVANVWHVFGFMYSIYQDWKEVKESGPEAGDAMEILKNYARGDLHKNVVWKYRIGDQLMDEEQEFRSMHSKILNYLSLEEDKAPEPVPSQPKIQYDIKTGIGTANGKEFKLRAGKPKFNVFAKLYNQIGEPVSENEILELAFYDPIKNTNSTYFINELAKGLRKQIGLSKSQLVQNNGELTLRA